MQVFISYSRKDSQYARMIVEHLKQRGIDVWMDDRIEYGSKWTTEIEKALNESPAVIVIMSPNSKESEWVQNEVAYAQDRKKKIFPLLVEGEIWLSLAATQSTDVRGGKLPPAEFYEEIRRVVKEINPWSQTADQAWIHYRTR
jgi:adenylate cyclase